MPHVCGCYTCDPVRFPAGPREGEHHAAVRFGEAGLYDVTLAGAPVKYVVEVWAGPQGRAVRAAEPLHPCGCGAGVCLEEHRGDYGIVRRQAPE